MLPLSLRRSDQNLALAAGGLFLGLLGYFAHFFSSTRDLQSSVSEQDGRVPPAKEHNIQKKTPPIPPEYGIPCGSAGQMSPTDACLDAASAEYLRDLRGNAVEFCSSLSGGIILNFPAGVNEQEQEPELHENEPPMGMFDLCMLRTHWGYGPVFDHDFHLIFEPQYTPKANSGGEGHEAKQSNYSMLIRRERPASFWDSLMEIMAMTLSVDVPRMSSNVDMGDSFIKVPADLPRTQVIVLDDLPQGPLYDMWSLFAGSAPVRLEGILKDKARADALLSEHTAIIPLPGRSNPLARIDQHDVSDRRYSALARTFSRRVLQKYGLISPWWDAKGISKSVRVTLVTWPDTREIRDVGQLLRALRVAFPDVLVAAADLAAMPMEGQLKMVQSTDVLVGVHGAGLSQIMFMREDEGAVVEIQPAGPSVTQHPTRYKNLAATLGQKYFSVEADVVPLETGQGRRGGHGEKPWRVDRFNEIEIDPAKPETELSLDKDQFVAQVGQAIEALGS